MKEELSACEAPIMKLVWESDSDISVPELINQVNVQLGKEYARTTVVTFLTRLAQKGYIETKRQGRVSYVHALKSEKEYKQMLAQREIAFWFHGNLSEFIQGLWASAPLVVIERIRVSVLLDLMD